MSSTSSSVVHGVKGRNDGTKVLASVVCDIADDGKIARETVVQAWIASSRGEEAQPPLRG